VLLVVLNHKHINEVQTIVQLFFPDERLVMAEMDDNTCDESSAHSEYIIKSSLDSAHACAVIYKGRTVAAEYAWPFSNPVPYLSPKRMIMLALFHALQNAVGAYTPWGALTGIRPSRMVREWFDEGYSAEGIVEILRDPFCVHSEKARLALEVARAEVKVNHKIYATGKKPVGIYVSIPFCPTRCVYCSFNTSHKPVSADFQVRYVDALIAECAAKAAELSQMGGTVSSIYIGGGTPTALDVHLLARVLDAVGTAFGAAAEYTVEAGRPDTLSIDILKTLRQYGVNRIAVNPQTLNDKTLKTIGRQHTAADFFSAFDMARDAGFDSINTDVIVGLPSENTDDVKRTMDALAKISPENITVHTLAVKRASRLRENKSSFVLPTAQETESMLSIAASTCAQSGLSPYYLYRQKNMVGLFENVGYSKPGHECLYNVGMMAETQTILGIGAGAVSKTVEGTKISRIFNNKDVQVYIEKQGAATQ